MIRALFRPGISKRYFFSASANFGRTSRSRAQTTGDDMDKKAMREEAERLMREAMAAKGVTVKQGDTRIMATCGRCGAQNKVSAPKGTSRVTYACKECGVEQMAM